MTDAVSWSDSDDDLLVEEVKKYEDKSRPDTENVTKESGLTGADDCRSPLERFRPGYLWVSDLTKQNWCEQQLFYSFTVPSIVEKSPVMMEGSNLHLARELAVHDVVKVEVTSNEDVWAIKVLNLLTSIQQFLNNESLVREVPIFGAPFGEDIFIVGLIDELRFDADTYQIDLQELKTRKFKSPPSASQRNQHRLQVMLYKKLFDDLVKGKLSKETVTKHLRVSLTKEFGSSVQNQIYSSCMTGENLDQLMDLLFQKMQCLTCINQIGVEYVHQESNETLFHLSLEYDDSELESLYKDYIQFWRGARDVRGVDIEEAYKCQLCEFADICEWRQRKAEEYSNKKRKTTAGLSG